MVVLSHTTIPPFQEYYQRFPGLLPANVRQRVGWQTAGLLFLLAQPKVSCAKQLLPQEICLTNEHAMFAA
jgi:hypothetical protein